MNTGKHDRACCGKGLRYARSFVCLWRGAKLDEHDTEKHDRACCVKVLRYARSFVFL